MGKINESARPASTSLVTRPASGVHPRAAMAAMRHSRIDLTMNYCTDPTLLDVAGAVNALPAFGGPAGQSTTREGSA
jgi:hypothetical protein